MSPLFVGKITWSRVVRSEWAKLWSLRSSWYVMALSVTWAYALAGVVGVAVRYGDVEKIQMDPVLVSLSGLSFAQLLLPVLGIMVVTSEYSTGTIQATLAAVPRRLWVLWAKIAVIVAVTLPVFLFVACTAFPLTQTFLEGSHLEATYSTPGARRAVVGAGVSLALLGVIGVGLGAVTRSTPLAIGQFVVGLTVLPQAMGLMPYEWAATASRYMPLKASESLMSARTGVEHAPPREALLALLVWAGAAVVASSVSVARRDA